MGGTLLAPGPRVRSEKVSPRTVAWAARQVEVEPDGGFVEPCRHVDVGANARVGAACRGAAGPWPGAFGGAQKNQAPRAGAVGRSRPEPTFRARPCTRA